jgi:metal-dependent amidase/aminoacylase/carboxypeptidase family protein
MAMMVHCQADTPECNVFVHGGSTGFVGKMVRITGKEAHAGAAPHEGINALNAAMAALMCINAQRETFRDEDHIRVHPIITKGGDLVNIVPADVRMETYVRGKSIGAVMEANRKVNMAIRGGVYAIGAKAEIMELPGYLPLKQDFGMGELLKTNAAQLPGVGKIEGGIDMFGSTDIGDLSSIIPVIQPTMGGYKGQAHSRDFRIMSEEAAYILPAKAMAMTIIDLLWNGAAEAVSIKQSYRPQFTRETYLKMWERLIENEKPEELR